MIKSDNMRITITIPKKIHEKILREADYEDRSVSNMILKILKEYYNIKGDD